MFFLLRAPVKELPERVWHIDLKNVAGTSSTIYPQKPQEEAEADRAMNEVDADYDDDNNNVSSYTMDEEDEYSYEDEDDDDGLMINPLVSDAFSEAYSVTNILSQQSTTQVSTAYFEMNEDDSPDPPATSLTASTPVAAFTSEEYWKAVTIRKNEPFLPHLLDSFRSYLESSIFVESCKREGLINPVFTWKQPARALANKFLQKSLTSEDDDNDVTVGLVFHGTPPQNIRSILKNGLDPNQRKNQVYGRGEYFGKMPSVSLSYCFGGNRMLVFCVVDVATPSPRLQLPPGYVVVQESAFQLPLGVLSFSSASTEMIHKSRALQNDLRRLIDQARKHESLAHEAKLKAKIIQFLIRGELELAAVCYKKAKGALSQDCKKEIAFYAYQRQTDPEFVDYYFDGELPPPMDCRWTNFKSLSVDKHEKQAEAVREKINEARKRMGTSST